MSMLYVLIAEDAPGSAVLRRELMQAHLDWVLTVMARVRVAGPLKTAPDGEPCMSLYIIEATSEADARDFIAADPYLRGGVWRQVTVRPFVAAAGSWVGGASWLPRA